jgi:hypothetical protein
LLNIKNKAITRPVKGFGQGRHKKRKCIQNAGLISERASPKKRIAVRISFSFGQGEINLKKQSMRNTLCEKNSTILGGFYEKQSISSM